MPGYEFLLFLLASFVLIVYFYPTIKAIQFRQPLLWVIASINFLAGWTIIGWIVAITMAERKPKDYHV